MIEVKLLLGRVFLYILEVEQFLQLVVQKEQNLYHSMDSLGTNEVKHLPDTCPRLMLKERYSIVELSVATVSHPNVEQVVATVGSSIVGWLDLGYEGLHYRILENSDICWGRRLPDTWLLTVLTQKL